MRIKVQAYGPSKSAKELANYMGVKRLLTNGRSRFRARAGDIIVNWGNPKQVHLKATYLNPLAAVKTASNKLSTFRALKAANVKVPVFDTDCSFAEDTDQVMARTTLYGHSGQGIVIGTPSELPQAPLYVEMIATVYEYRAIVVDGKVVDFKQKLKKRDFEGDRSEHVWNCDNGYVFARNDIRHPDDADYQAINAMSAIGLQYGAVDLIEDEAGTVYVLEINTAFGLTGTTIQLVGDAINELL